MMFVSIASYRDPELIPTLQSMYENADWPERLHVAICWQHDEQAERPVNPGFRAFTVIDVPYMEAKGCCWARTQTQKAYDGESYYLQLDSHHRFIPSWDYWLYRWGRICAKPVIGSYAMAYEIGQPLREGVPLIMQLDRFTENHAVLFKPSYRYDLKPEQAPIPARYVSGHFLFAPGTFVRDVPSDPGVYFTGEELALAIRAYTHGYDLFHPPKHILWHEYSRAARPKHWDDHRRWHIQDAISQSRVLDLLANRITDGYGLGNQRTVADYERYTGLDFTNWTATEECVRGDDPIHDIPANRG